VSSAHLEVAIERAGSKLKMSEATLWLEPPRIVFHAPAGVVDLLYGDKKLVSPGYDLAAALATGKPGKLATAELGPERTLAAESHPGLSPPPRAPLAHAERWTRRQNVRLPKQGTLAYLDVSGPAARAPDELRIVDQQGRQVPYVLETSERRQHESAEWSSRNEGEKTLLMAPFPAERHLVRGIVLGVKSPAYFERRITVSEVERDDSAGASNELTSTRWERLPDDGSPLELSVALTAPTLAEALVTIDNGDNPPLAVTSVSFALARPRIDFAFSRSDALTLLSGNPEANAPRYDLRLLTDVVLTSPAWPASLHPPSEPAVAPPLTSNQRPRWFWLAVVVAAAVVFSALARTLRAR
jgi:hypothetical protein